LATERLRTPRQAASLFRVLANPTRLAILLTLQTGEERITDLAAQLGGSQANISAHLTTAHATRPRRALSFEMFPGMS